jgi:hypothetical protein
LAPVPKRAEPPAYITVRDEWTQDVPSARLDVLAVIDTSCSMSDDRGRLAVGMANVVSDLHSAQVDWSLTYAAATPGPNIIGPVQLGPDAQVADLVTVSMSVLDLQAPGWEAGFAGARVAEPYTRQDADLLVLLVSDEDDQSYLLDNSPDDPEQWAEWLIASSHPSVDVVAIIANGYPCGARGDRYMLAVEHGGWSTVDLCSEWPSVLSQASWLTSQRRKWWLSRVPRGPVTVTVDGDAGWLWTLYGRELTFDNPPPNGAALSANWWDCVGPWRV